jgi:hypothetical protein
LNLVHNNTDPQSGGASGAIVLGKMIRAGYPAAADRLAGMIAAGSDGTTTFNGGAINFVANQQWGAAAAGTDLVVELMPSGSTTRTEKFRIGGDGKVTAVNDARIKVAAYPKLLLEATGNGADLKKVQIYVGPDGAINIAALNDAENAEQSTRKLNMSGGVFFNGPLTPGGDAGTSVKVMTGNPSGVPTWKTLAELGIGVQEFATLASVATTYDGINQTVSIAHVKGCTAQHRRNTASYYKSEITFLTAQPDTSYQVFGMIQVDGSTAYRAVIPSDISATTVNGFALNNTQTSAVGWLGFSIRVVR